MEKRQTNHLNMISELRAEHFQSVGYDKIWHLLSMSKYKGIICYVLMKPNSVSCLGTRVVPRVI